MFLRPTDHQPQPTTTAPQCFPYIALILFFLFNIPVTFFHLRFTVIFGLRGPFTIRRQMFLNWKKSRLKGSILRLQSKQFSNITLVIFSQIFMACDLSLQAIFSNNYDGNNYISFQDLYDPRGRCFKMFDYIYGIIKINFGHYVGKYGPWY